MARQASQTEQDRRQGAEQNGAADQGQRRASNRRGQSRSRAIQQTDEQRPTTQRRLHADAVFTTRGAVRVGLLRLARDWQEAGAVYQAIHTYTEVLVRYPGTGAAAAATEELIAMAEMLKQQGKFYAALNIFNKLEQLV